MSIVFNGKVANQHEEARVIKLLQGSRWRLCKIVAVLKYE